MGSPCAARMTEWPASAKQRVSQPIPTSPRAPAGRFGLYGWLRMLVVSYFSNLLGALLLVSSAGSAAALGSCLPAKLVAATTDSSADCLFTPACHWCHRTPSSLQVGLMKGGDVFHSGRGDFLIELAEVGLAWGCASV